MNFFTFTFFAIFVLQSRTILVKSCENQSDSVIESSKEVINVFTRNYDPYISGIGRLQKGIEFKLMETIGKTLEKCIVYSSSQLLSKPDGSSNG